MKRVILIISLLCINSCFVNPNKVRKLTCMSINKGENNFLYNDFPNRDRGNTGCNILDIFIDGCPRTGIISYNGYKEGKFITNHCNNLSKRFSKEEYFKKGLRDSIFRQYDNNGNIIYETTFKDGTGLWKEFHSNGQLYFEMYTKNGYFTDTLRLYDDKGTLIGKRLYIKDSLVYSSGKPCFPCLEGRYDF